MLGHHKRLERKLKEEGGKRAWATILESKKGRTTTGGVIVAPGQPGSITMRREFRVRVEPEDEAWFEATVNQTFNDLHGPHIPDDGSSITVIYDPDDDSKIVMDVEGLVVEPGFDRNTAVAVREKVKRRQQDPMASAESGDRADQYRAVARDPTLSPEEKRGKMMELSMGMGAAPRTVFSGGQIVPPATAPDPTAAIDALAKLADLRDRGVLTDAEFEAQKVKLLGSS